MIQKQNRNKPLFLIQCGDWECVRQSETPLEACSDAIIEAKLRYGECVGLSPVIISMDLKKQLEGEAEPITAFSINSAIEYEKPECCNEY